MKVLWTRHADDRLKLWGRSKGITKNDVEFVLQWPAQVVDGIDNVKTAQRPWKEGLMRVPFVDTPDGRKVLTLYWTSKVIKYWRMDDNEH